MNSDTLKTLKRMWKGRSWRCNRRVAELRERIRIRELVREQQKEE